MDRFKNWGIGFILLGFLFLSLLATIRPTIDIVEDSDPDRPDFRFEGVRLSMYEKGRRQWVMIADNAEFFLPNSQALLRNVKTQLLDTVSNVTMKSATATIDTEANTIALTSAGVEISGQRPVLLSIPAPGATSTQRVGTCSGSSRLSRSPDLRRRTYGTSASSSKSLKSSLTSSASSWSWEAQSFQRGPSFS